jgi:hypothetical protein
MGDVVASIGQTSMRNVLIGLMVVGLTACGSSLGTGSGSGGRGGQGTSGTAGAMGGASVGGGGGVVGGGGTGGAGGGVGGASSGPPITCTPGIPATTQLRRMRNRQYDATVRDLLGVTTVDVGGGAKAPSTELYADFDGPMIPDAWRLYKDVGTAIAKAVMANPTQKAKFITCDPATAGCLTTTIQSFGRKAFRRPLTTAEVTRFEALGQGTSIGTPTDVAEATLLAFLLSPSFLMVPEMTTMAGSSAPSIQLSSHEVAARLSFLLWGSVPDDVLNTAADGNQLQTKDQILAQARRMIAMRDKAASQVSAFHRYWAGMDNASGHWWAGDHDVAKFPLYSPAAKTTYSAELDNFFAEIAFTNGSYKDLLLSNVGFVNKDNAAIYGLSNSGTALTRVELDPMQRPGFLTRAGFLSSYAHYDSTAPILRGAYINLNLIGIDPGPPIPGAFTLMPPTGVYSTNRERTEALTSQSASCQGCHANILNPPGFVLENYDAIGKWQTIDPLGGPINAAATVNFGDGNTKQIANAQELMQQLAQTRKGTAMYAQSLVSYGYGRDRNSNDQCVVDQISARLAANGAILDALADLTQADSFRMRVRAP